MHLATIATRIDVPDDIPEKQLNMVLDLLNDVDWESLAHTALGDAGLGKTVLEQLTFHDDSDCC